MIKHFLNLEWKAFFRSSYWKRSLALKIFLIFIVLYFLTTFLFLGAMLFSILKETFPEQDPLIIVSNYLLFWVVLNMVARFFFQNLPILNIKPLLLLPIKKRTVIHYLLLKSTSSIFNFISFIAFIPFSAVLLLHGYPFLNVLTWFISVLFITLTLNFINFIINKKNSLLFSLIFILLALTALQYFHIFAITDIAGKVFYSFYTTPYCILFSIILLVGTYFLNYNFLKRNFYLEEINSKRIKKAESVDLSWINRFGEIAPFLKNDIRLIWRNVRPKKVMYFSLFPTIYFFFIITNAEHTNSMVQQIFWSILITGTFLMSFGQLVPSWDSEYYKLLMSQNIKYKIYLESKWYLMVLSVIILTVLATPYLYFGLKIYSLIVAGAFFNIGIGSYLVLLGGVYNRRPIELNTKAQAFSNTQAFNVKAILIGLPRIFLPIILFYISYKLINYRAGVITVFMTGLVGILFKNFFLTKIEVLYQKEKYKTIAAYNEKQ